MTPDFIYNGKLDTMRTLLITLFYFTFFILAHAQDGHSNEFPEMGRPCPDFILRYIKYYPLKQASLKDFKGKWLVLDFWSKGCGSCVVSFPHANAIQKEFGYKIQVMLVGRQDAESQIEPMYERYREKEHLVMPCDFDSVLPQQWCIWSVPHIIIVDDNGIVRGVTNMINRSQIAAFLRGEQPLLSATYHSQCNDFHDPRDDRIPFDPMKPYLVNGNGGSDSNFLFRSILTRWNPRSGQNEMGEIDFHAVDSTYPKGYFQILGFPLEWLYRFAYFGRRPWGIKDTAWYGKYAIKPIIETKDSGVFRYEYGPTYKNIFSYSLIIPKEQGSRERLQQIMQRDLKNYFGFDASVETRQLPCWKLVATDEARIKLRTAGGKPNSMKIIIPHAVFSYENVPVKQIIPVVAGAACEEGAVIFDETGVVGNIDITLDCINRDDMLQCLHDNGLSLVSIEKEMKVLVIRDPREPGTASVTR